MDENIKNNVPGEEVVVEPVVEEQTPQEAVLAAEQTVETAASNAGQAFNQGAQQTVNVVVSKDNTKEPGKGAAVASLVLGIISVVAWFFGIGAIVGLITGIIGLVCATNSKKAGFDGGLRTAGFVLSILGTIGSAIVFVACIACVGAIGANADAIEDLANSL